MMWFRLLLLLSLVCFVHVHGQSENIAGFRTPIPRLYQVGSEIDDGPRITCHLHQGQLIIAGVNATKYSLLTDQTSKLYNFTETRNITSSITKDWSLPPYRPGDWTVYGIVNDPNSNNHIYAVMGYHLYAQRASLVHVNTDTMLAEKQLSENNETKMRAIGRPRFGWLWVNNRATSLIMLTTGYDNIYISRVGIPSRTNPTLTFNYDDHTSHPGRAIAAAFQNEKDHLLILMRDINETLTTGTLLLFDVETLTLLQTVAIPNAVLDQLTYDCLFDVVSQAYYIKILPALLKVVYTSDNTIQILNNTSPYIPYLTREWYDFRNLFEHYLIHTLVQNPVLGTTYFHGVLRAGGAHSIAILNHQRMTVQKTIIFPENILLHSYPNGDPIDLSLNCFVLDSQKGYLYTVDRRNDWIFRVDINVDICPPGVNESCSVCPIGTFSTRIPLQGDMTGGERISCEPCSINTYNNKTSAKECIPCEDGQFTSSTGQTTCESCSPLSVYDPQSRVCVCDRGAGFVRQIKDKLIQCAVCAAGSYKADFGNAACTPCQPFSSVVNNSYCACNRGYYRSSLHSRGLEATLCKTATNTAEVAGTCCLPCPKNGDCSDVDVSPVSGHWWPQQAQYVMLRQVAAANRTLSASQFNQTSYMELGDIHLYQCSQKEACTPEGCKLGYTGFLCGACDEGYAVDGALTRCIPASGTNSPMFGIIIVVGAIVVGHLFRSSTDAGTIIPAVIVINHLQLATEADYGSDLLRFITVFQFNLLTIGSGRALNEGSFVNIWLLDLLLPMALHGLAWFWYVVFKCADHISARWNHSHLPGTVRRSHQLLLTHMSIFLFTFIGCTKTALLVFDCRQVDDRTVFRVYPSIECWTGTHSGMVTISIIFLSTFVLLIPTILALLLFKPSCLPARLTSLHLTFITSSYREECYWWELVIISRRTLYAVVVVAFSSFPFSRSCALILLTTLYLALHLSYSPYNTHRDNLFETITLQILIVCFVINQLWQQDLQQQLGYAIALILLNGFVLVAGCALCVHVLVLRFHDVRQQRVADNKPLQLATMHVHRMSSAQMPDAAVSVIVESDRTQAQPQSYNPWTPLHRSPHHNCDQFHLLNHPSSPSSVTVSNFNNQVDKQSQVQPTPSHLQSEDTSGNDGPYTLNPVAST